MMSFCHQRDHAERPAPSARTAVLSLLIILCTALLMPARASAADTVYFAATDSITNALVQRINAETVRIDLSAWYLTERAVTQAVVNRFNAGVQVRLIGDRGSIFEIDANTREEFYWLANKGIPIRLRYHPTWFPELDHWKAIIFAGQNIVAFGSANFTTFELAPWSSTNYNDEIFLFSDDQTLVKAFKTKFDKFWNDTAPEPNSLVPSAPYFKNWNDACALESACSDYQVKYPNPAPMVINTARLEPDNPLPPTMVWGQGSEFNNRLSQEIANESTGVDFVVYRLTVDNITNALLAKFGAGVPVRLIIEPNEYLNRRWPEFWITHANLDKLWAAGVPIKQRTHQGNTHMKLLVTSTIATVASSNYTAAWQRDHNYFLPASSKPAVHQAIKNRFQTMWNDSASFTNFVPQGPDAPSLVSPGNGAGSLSTTPTLSWTLAPFATNFDVFLGTSPGSLSKVGNVQAQLVNDPPDTYSWAPSSPLQGGTTYYWQIVSRTNATPVNPSLVAASGIRSFTTSGTPGGGGGGSVPSPWSAQDIGSTGVAGSATFSSGTFTVKGAGADIWGSADSFHFVSQPLSGDGTIVARVTGVQNTHTYAKAGIMLRQSLTAGSAHVILDVRPDGSVEFMTRSTSGAGTTFLASAGQSPPAWLRLARSGSTVTASVSANGTAWTTVGSTTTSMSASTRVGLAVTSHNTGVLNTSTFDSVSVTGDGGGGEPVASNIVIYASDVPAAGLHGSWSTAADAASPGGTKLVTTDTGYAATSAPLAAPVHYIDATFTAAADTPYHVWLRLKALNNNKFNDAVWVQFTDARANGSPIYTINSTSGLLVNLATDGNAGSLNNWGWQDGAYWLSQPTTVMFPTTGTRTIRVQVREDGVQLDQIVLSPTTYLNSAPGPATNDSTIVPKP